MIFYPKICWFTRFVVNCRESNLRTFCHKSNVRCISNIKFWNQCDFATNLQPCRSSASALFRCHKIKESDWLKQLHYAKYVHCAICCTFFAHLQHKGKRTCRSTSTSLDVLSLFQHLLQDGFPEAFVFVIVFLFVFVFVLGRAAQFLLAPSEGNESTWK